MKRDLHNKMVDIVVWSSLFFSIHRTPDFTPNRRQSQKEVKIIAKKDEDYYLPLIVEEDVHHQALVKVVRHPEVKESTCCGGAPRKHIVRWMVSKSRNRKVTLGYSFCPLLSRFVLWLSLFSR